MTRSVGNLPPQKFKIDMILTMAIFKYRGTAFPPQKKRVCSREFSGGCSEKKTVHPVYSNTVATLPLHLRTVPPATVCTAQPHEAPEAFHERKIKEIPCHELKMCHK